MSKRKNFYYVLVLTTNGPVFVTGVKERKFAEFNRLEKPLELGSKSYADEISLGLTLNLFLAFTIQIPYELEGQLYFYENGKFVWEQNEKEEN